ncbi:MAG: hypothetical protein JXB33_00885 [Clostridia bacterium]|nr:hypothetical protein [Clostridia bacterium]
MDKKRILRMAAMIVFYGSLWGAAEATLGYLMHFLPPAIAGMTMFPIAVFILIKAGKATGSRASLIAVGLVAAGIKAVDLLIPGMMVFKTINPMISIVLESLVVAAAYPVLRGTSVWGRILAGPGMSMGWRSGYIIYMLMQYLVAGSMTKFISTPYLSFEFIVLGGLAGGLIVSGVLMAEPRLRASGWKFRPAYAVAVLAAALCLQFLL